MGAICGILSLESKNKVSAKLLKTINKAMAHRGPDGENYFIDSQIGLGSRLLKTVTSKEKPYPISNEDRSIYLILDGELYNYDKIKEALEEKGHRFFTQNSGEIIIHLYEEFGEGFIEKIEGAFSFALWDSNQKKLIIGRDRFGTKPLYYTRIDNQLIFSSELKSLMKNPQFEKNLDPFAFRYCLQFRYTISPQTIFKNVKKVNPGSMLVAKNGKFKEMPYWDLAFEEKFFSVNDYKKLILKKLRESIARRCTGEYPAGVFLSGGIDSSLIVALLSKIGPEPVRTYVVGFQEEGYYNELKYARIVAEKFGTDHHEVLISSDAIMNTPKTMWHIEYPTGITNLNLNYLAYQKAKVKNKIIFVGDGADEFFGPHICKKIHYLHKLRFIPPHMRDKLAGLIHQLRIPKYSNYLGNFLPYANDVNGAFFRERQKFSDDDMKQFNASELSFEGYQSAREEVFKKIKERSKSRVVFNQIQYLTFRTSSTNMVQELIDRMGMAFSVEKRYPFLDYGLVDLLSGIPLKLKSHGQQQKFLLQKAAIGLLPKDIIYRKKEPFLPSPDLWVRDQKEIISHFVLEFKKRNYFENRFIDKLLEFKDLRKNSNQLWTLFATELWFRIFIDNCDLKEKDMSLSKLW